MLQLLTYLLEPSGAPGAEPHGVSLPSCDGPFDIEVTAVQGPVAVATSYIDPVPLASLTESGSYPFAVVTEGDTRRFTVRGSGTVFVASVNATADGPSIASVTISTR
jgi:hypothetical protein